MYCFRCGRKLPGREINCPDCDTPQKRRQRRHRRMFLGLVIFLSGAFVGSLFDTYIFKGEVWKHSFFNELIGVKYTVGSDASNSSNASETITAPVKVEMKYDNNSVTTLYSEKELTQSNNSPVNDTVVSNEPLKEDIKTENKVLKDNIENTKTVNNENEKNTELNIINNDLSKVNTESDNTSLASASSLINEIEIKKEDNASSEVILSEVPQKTKSDEVIIVEELDNGLTDSIGSMTETTLFSESSNIEASESAKINDGNLIYKNVSLLELSDRDSYHAFVSKNGKELVFASNRLNYNGKPTFQCFIKSPSENAPAKRVFEWKGNVWTPELTPDSNMIVFSSDSVKPEHIFLYDRKSGNNMPLTSGDSKNMMPSISPDGKKIAFVSNRGDGKNRIYIVDLFNKNKITQITKGIVNDREPRWTPDGKSIIFTRIVENMKISHIMKVNIEPLGEPKAVVSGNTRNWMADISPDNNILAFTRSLNAGGSKNVIVLKDLKSGKEEILNFPGIYESFRPIWNSDCSGFVFHVAKKSGKCIYKANFIRE